MKYMNHSCETSKLRGDLGKFSGNYGQRTTDKGDGDHKAGRPIYRTFHVILRKR